jgi:hypothetical protein
VATTFAGIDSVRLELAFAGVAPTPAPQAVVLHAGAPAFFEFACPCNDCDGSLFLGAAVTSAIKSGGGPATGTVTCSGGRVVAGQSIPCGLNVTYVVTGTPIPT